MELTLNYLHVFFRALHDPEYSYLFFEPMLLYGVAFGLLVFLFGIFIKEQKTKMFGLICIIGACLMIAPYLGQRKAAEERIISVFGLSQPDRAYGFSYNNEDRSKKQWLFWVTAGLATMTILFAQGDSPGRVWLVAGTIAFCALTILYSSLAHYEESKVYHPNLRQELGPPAQVPASLGKPPVPSGG